MRARVVGDELPELEADAADHVGVHSDARGRSVMCVWWEGLGRVGQTGQNPNAN